MQWWNAQCLQSKAKFCSLTIHICRYTAAPPQKKNRGTSLVDLTRTYTIKRDSQCCAIQSAFIAQSLWHKICNQTSNTWWRRYVQHAQNCSGSFCIAKKMNDKSATDNVSILAGWTSSTHSVCSCLSSRHITRSLYPQRARARVCVRAPARSAQTRGTVTVQHSQWPLLQHSSIWFQHMWK